MRNKLPSYGAWAGAAVAAYFVSKQRQSGSWHPVSTFAESMTVGYLAGFLAAPLIWKPCTDTEKALEAGGSMFGAHPFAAFRRDPNDPCGHIEKSIFHPSNAGGGRVSKNPEYQACRSKYSDANTNTIRKGPIPVAETFPDPFNQPLPEGCADWSSGPCKADSVYNTIDGSVCPERPGMVRSYAISCPEHKKTTLDYLKKLPNWAWIAAGAGAVLLLSRRRE